MAIKVRFKKSTTSKDWKKIEDALPGAKSVLENTMLILKLTSNGDVNLYKNASKGVHKYTIGRGRYIDHMLTIRIEEDKNPVIRIPTYPYQDHEVSTTEEFETFMKNWTIRL